jgi:hypothetical protein
MKYTGKCHCGAVRYEAEADLSTVIECNCSYCAMKGLILAFTPAEQVTLLTPDAALTEYQFNKKHIHHMFCPVCGVQPFSHGNNSEGVATYALNVRCIEGIDLAALNPKPVNGKDF